MKKLITYLRWFFVVFFVGVFGLLTSWIMYPLAEVINSFTKINPLWFWLDSTKYNKDGSFKDDYSIYISQYGGEETFKVKYLWHVLRNRVWNLTSLFKPKEGDEVITELKVDELYRNGKKVVVNGSKYVETAGLKYAAKNGENPWQVNRGDEIDFRYSTIGKSFLYYSVESKLYFRYSYCIKVNYLGLKYWRTIKLGTNRERFVLTLKHQKQ